MNKMTCNEMKTRMSEKNHQSNDGYVDYDHLAMESCYLDHHKSRLHLLSLSALVELKKLTGDGAVEVWAMAMLLCCHSYYYYSKD